MIPAHKFWPGEQLVWWLIHSSLHSHFDRIFFRMQAPLTEEQRRLPIIVCANHSSWWDGYIAALIEHHLNIDTYLMMEESQLRRYFFFAWAGCFSVDRQNARSAMQSLHYAADLLHEQPKKTQRAGRIVWIFPQGEISPNDHRPLIFFSGAAHLAKLSSPCLVYPLASRIEYLAEQRPDLYISMGDPLCIDSETVKQPHFLKNYTKEFEVRVTEELDSLRTDILASEYSSFNQVGRGRLSINRIFDAALLRRQMKHQ
jgi:chlorobactene lauroyltransferase